mmetsp:Transcript_61891/g.133094  ORF Transcript_61891/g.133094 Transcript_61891/m.133094 type:complete len:258 (-) Transcript_61891:198-971(-)
MMTMPRTRALFGLALLAMATRLIAQQAFAVPVKAPVDSTLPGASALRGAAARQQGPSPDNADAVRGCMAFGFAAAATVAILSTKGGSRDTTVSKAPRRYSTQTILPSLAWLPTKCKSADLDNGNLEVRCLAGVDIVLGKTESGKLFALADKCPPTGTSLSIGGEVIGETVVDPQYGTRFNVFTGVPEGDWCPSPPVVGGFVGFLMGGPQCVQTFDCRETFLSKELEVQLDVNTRKAYEANYWKGLLDAQGKNDGTYY